MFAACAPERREVCAHRDLAHSDQAMNLGGASSCRALRRQPPFGASCLGGRPATATRMRSTNDKENAVPSNVCGGGNRKSPRIGSQNGIGISRGLTRNGPGAGVKAGVFCRADALNDVTNFADARAPRDKKQTLPGVQKRPSLGPGTRVATNEPQARGMAPPIPPGPNVMPPQGVPQASPLPPPHSLLQSSVDDLRWGGEYGHDLFNQLFLEEAAHLPRPDYMELQSEINAKMRAILVDWLVEVHMKYRLRAETHCLTVNLVDRYLSRTQVLRKRLQLVGVTAMFIASKFEEITPPEVTDFAYITDYAYSKDEILQMECDMLTTLDFRISAPTAAHFSHRLHHVNQSDAAHHHLACYLVELALVEYRMVRYTPSHLVAAAALVSNDLVGRQPIWPAQMCQQARYTEDQLRACANELRALLDAAPNNSLQAVRKRYMLDQHHRVASMTFQTN